MSCDVEQQGESKVVVKILSYKKLMGNDAEGMLTTLFNEVITTEEKAGWGLEDVKFTDVGERGVTSNSSGGVMVVFILWKPIKAEVTKEEDS